MSPGGRSKRRNKGRYHQPVIIQWWNRSSTNDERQTNHQPIGDGVYKIPVLYHAQYLSFRAEILWGFQTSKIDSPWRLDRKRAGDKLEKNDVALRMQHTLVRANEAQDARWLTFSKFRALFYAHCNALAYARWHTRRPQGGSESDHERPKRGQWSSSWKSPPLPWNSWNNPPSHQPMKLPSLQKQPPCVLGLSPSEMAHTQWRECVFLRISLPSLYYGLLVNSFLCEAERTHAWWPCLGLSWGPGLDHSLTLYFLSYNRSSHESPGVWSLRKWEVLRENTETMRSILYFKIGYSIPCSKNQLLSLEFQLLSIIRGAPERAPTSI